MEAPKAAVDEMQEGAAVGVTRRLVLTPQPAPDFLAAYKIQIKDGSSYITEFSFKKSYEGIRIKISLDNARKMSTSRFWSAAKPAGNQQLCLFYWTGVEWVKLGAVNDIEEGEAYITTRRLGTYAVRYAVVSTSFVFTKVAPRIFSPAESNPVINQTCWYFDGPGDDATVKLFDITGARVRRSVTRVSSQSLCWDGKDDGGSIVKGGVYIYQLEAGGEAITGTVVVAH